MQQKFIKDITEQLQVNTNIAHLEITIREKSIILSLYENSTNNFIKNLYHNTDITEDYLTHDGFYYLDKEDITEDIKQLEQDNKYYLDDPITLSELIPRNGITIEQLRDFTLDFNINEYFFGHDGNYDKIIDDIRIFFYTNEELKELKRANKYPY